MAPSKRPSRRRFLTAVGAGAAALLGGCAATSDAPGYERREVSVPDGEPRSAPEMAAAAALAQQEANQSASPLDSLSLADHEFVLEDGYNGSTVQGTVENAGDSTVDYVEVRVRVYGADGAQLGRYLATIGDLPTGARWQFEVILLVSPGDIAEYDIAVLGIPK